MVKLSVNKARPTIDKCTEVTNMSKKDKVEAVEEQPVVAEQQTEELDFASIAEQYRAKFNLGKTKGDSMMGLVVAKMKEDNKNREEVLGKVIYELEQKGKEITPEEIKKVQKLISTVVCQTDNKSGIYTAYKDYKIVNEVGMFKLAPKE